VRQVGYFSRTQLRCMVNKTYESAVIVSSSCSSDDNLFCVWARNEVPISL